MNIHEALNFAISLPMKDIDDIQIVRKFSNSHTSGFHSMGFYTNKNGELALFDAESGISEETDEDNQVYFDLDDLSSDDWAVCRVHQPPNDSVQYIDIKKEKQK